MTGEDYSDSECAGLVAALEPAFKEIQWRGGRRQMTVYAAIEWDGYYNPTKKRSTTLGPVQLDAVQAATVAAVGAYEGVREAAAADYSRPAPVTTIGKWNELNRSGPGKSAAAGAGLHVSRETARRWANGSQKPGKANRLRIDMATRDLYERRAEQARDRAINAAASRVDRACRKVADALTSAVHDSEQAIVRFRDIEYIEFEG